MMLKLWRSLEAKGVPFTLHKEIQTLAPDFWTVTLSRGYTVRLEDEAPHGPDSWIIVGCVIEHMDSLGFKYDLRTDDQGTCWAAFDNGLDYAARQGDILFDAVLAAADATLP